MLDLLARLAAFLLVEAMDKIDPLVRKRTECPRYQPRLGLARFAADSTRLKVRMGREFIPRYTLADGFDADFDVDDFSATDPDRPGFVQLSTSRAIAYDKIKSSGVR